MKINVAELLVILERQKRLSSDEKGVQPELSLGCFYGLDRGDTEYCERCRHYEGTCKSYLVFFQIINNFRDE